MHASMDVVRANFEGVTVSGDVVYFEFCQHEMDDLRKALSHASTLAPDIVVFDHFARLRVGLLRRGGGQGPPQRRCLGTFRRSSDLDFSNRTVFPRPRRASRQGDCARGHGNPGIRSLTVAALQTEPRASVSGALAESPAPSWSPGRVLPLWEVSDPAGTSAPPRRVAARRCSR